VAADDKTFAQALSTSTFWVGLIASRLAYVLLHADAYLSNPWALIDIRDGGWHATVGCAAIVVWLLWQLRDRVAVRWLAFQSAALGFTLCWAGFWWSDQQQIPQLPNVKVMALEHGEGSQLQGLLDGRPLVVNLWASWCGPCRQEMPILSKAQKSDTEVRFVFVNQGEAQTHVKEFLKQQNWELEDVWLDPSSSFGPAVGSQSLPTTLFYDAKGALIKTHIGVLTASSLQIQLSLLKKSLSL
jgi:thiol-disulfide isomerase/thioredoxin